MPPRKRGRKDKDAAVVAPVEDDRDYISALPDDALEHILSFVPAQDAVRTCVLARRWRHVWKTTKGVRIVTKGSIEAIKEFVDHFLLIRAGSTIDTFELRSKEGMYNVGNARVNLWIRHALACKAKVLQFDLVESQTWLVLRDIHLLFACQHLTCLEFVYVQFADCFLNFSSCPALQDLSIRRCELSDTKKISCQFLKHLTVTGCNSSYTFRTRIQAPNLVSLCLDETLNRAPVLERMPSLVRAFVSIHSDSSDICDHSTISDRCNDLGCLGCYDIEEDDTSCVLLQGLSVAQNLTLLAPSSDTFIFRRDLKCCPTFSHLKNLLLNEYWCMPDVDALACILEHSPVLEKLTLQLFSEGPKHQVEIKGNPNPNVMSAAISQHLKIVEVKCEVVNETVLNVLKFLGKLNMCFTFEL